MKIRLPIIMTQTALLLLAAVPGLVAQDSIGWNYSHSGFGDENLDPAEIAGAIGFEQANWNNHASAGQAAGATPLNDLLGDDGIATGVDVIGWSQSSSNSWHYDGHSSAPNAKLTGGFANNDPVITFGSVNSFTPDGYTVVVYYGNNEFANGGGQIDANGHIQNFQASDGFDGVGFIQNSDNGATDSNYAVFTGVTGDTLIVNMQSTQNDGISAIQIIKALNTDPPAAPASPSPANLAVNTAVDGILDWADSIRADEYDVFLWPSGDLEPGTPSATVAVSEYVPSGDLLESTDYSWRVLARNSGSGAETSGPMWSFTTGANLAPEAPVNPVPADMANGVAPATMLNWNDAALAASYNVYLWNPPAAKPGTPTAMTTASQFLPATVLDQGTEYHWTVEAVNGNGVTASVDAFWTFTTLSPPSGSPSNPIPEDLAADVPSIVKFEWSSVINASSYNIRVWSSSDSRPVEPTASVSSPQFIPGNALELSTNYSWDVEAVNALGATSGGPWSFTTGSASAQVARIGWNYSHSGFGDEDLSPTEVAGAPGFEQANWNNHASSGQAAGVTPLNDLLGDDGVATGVDVIDWTQSSGNSWHYNGHSSAPNAKLTGGFANTDPVISFGSVNSFTPDGYTVVVYFGNNEFANGGGQIDVNGKIQNFQASDGFDSVGFLLNSDDGATDSNYAVFTEVTGDTLTVDMQSNQNDGISAIQIIRSANDVLFAITNIENNAGIPTITFNSAPGQTYAVDRSLDLSFWGGVDDNVQSGGDSTVFVDVDLAIDFPEALPDRVFYRVRRQP